MDNKKYKLTDEYIELGGGFKLYRIEALIDFGDVKAGDKGGFIEREDNLSHEGTAWVYGNARVCDEATVYGNARVCGNATVCDEARVCGNATVYGNARVYGNADILTAAYIGSRFDTTTAFRNKHDGVDVSCGCFHGTLEEFADKVNEVHGDNKYGREYKAFIEMCKAHFGVNTEE